MDVKKPTDHFESVHSIDVDEQRMRDERAAYVDVSNGKDNAIEFGRQTLMVNASIMSVRYQPVQGPWLIDMGLQRASVG